jgi:hypothetical protein
MLGALLGLAIGLQAAAELVQQPRALYVRELPSHTTKPVTRCLKPGEPAGERRTLWNLDRRPLNWATAELAARAQAVTPVASKQCQR